MGSGDRGAVKKLSGAALHWLGVDRPPARPLTVDEGVADGLRRMGVSEADIEAQVQAHSAPEPTDFEVHEDCWESVLFFLRVQTQWVCRGMDGARAGLNYAGVEAAMRMDGVKRARQSALLDDLQLMERAVLKADGEQAPAQG